MQSRHTTPPVAALVLLRALQIWTLKAPHHQRRHKRNQHKHDHTKLNARLLCPWRIHLRSANMHILPSICPVAGITLLHSLWACKCMYAYILALCKFFVIRMCNLLNDWIWGPKHVVWEYWSIDHDIMQKWFGRVEWLLTWAVLWCHPVSLEQVYYGGPGPL